MSGGAVGSWDAQFGILKVGLFLTSTPSFNMVPAANVSIGGSASAGRGQFSGFYGDSNVLAVNTGQVSSSCTYNDNYEGGGAGASLGIGTPNASFSANSYTYGESTTTEIDEYSAINQIQNDLWNMSQDPLNPVAPLPGDLRRTIGPTRKDLFCLFSLPPRCGLGNPDISGYQECSM